MKLIWFVCLASLALTSAWESFEPDLFDLVEEVGENFYGLFGIDKSADSNAIRKAYRQLSLKFHPDKNQEADAEAKFRRIVGIYEVLKDEQKRTRYDQILEFGLPDWKQPIYYYRRARKLNILELLMTIGLVVTVGHYFVMWAVYFENRLCLDERLSETRRRMEKKQKKKGGKNIDMNEVDKNLDQIYDLLHKPSFTRTLPIRFLIFLYDHRLFFPFLIKLFSKTHENIDEKVVQDDENEELYRQLRVEEAEKKRKKLVDDLNPKNIDQKSNISPIIMANTSLEEVKSSDSHSKQTVDDTSNTSWSEAEKLTLIKAIQKYPAGVVDRWSVIAQFVGRSAQECSKMEKILKSTHFKLQIDPLSQIKKKSQDTEISDSIMTQRDDEDTTRPWSQSQQKQLEMALRQYGKDVSDRWDKVALCVDAKTKEECIQRFKQICQTINKSK